jgi:thioredoxin reductase (NADPH)
MSSKFDLIVIGAGIAGLTAARCAAERGKSVCLLEAELMGGLVVNVGKLEGYPTVEDVSGIELAMTLAEQCMTLGVQITEEPVESLTVEGDDKVVRTAASEFRAPRVIVASGAKLKQLGVPGETELYGRGVSQCAFCDGAMFAGQEVVVVGGGDAALQEALHLAEHCSKVTLVVRGNRLRARQSYVTRVADDPKFAFRWNTVVEAIEGADGVEGVLLRDTRNDTVESLACMGVFVFVGIAPNIDFLPETIIRGDDDGVAVNYSLESVEAGVYAVGAARSGYLGQVANAVGEGTAAAIAALR